MAAVATFDWSQTEEYAAYFKRSFPNFWSYLDINPSQEERKGEKYQSEKAGRL